MPGTFAAEDELFGIGRVLGELGTGVFELAPAGALGEDLAAPEREMDWMRRLAAAIERPVTFALSQNNADPDSWKRLLDLSAAAAAEGVPVRPQVHGRTVSLLLGFQTFHPLAFTQAWGDAGLGLLPVAGAGRAHRGRSRPGAPGSSPTPRCSRTTRSSSGSCTRAASTCSATRPSTSRAPSAAPRPSPPRAASTSGSCCSSCSSSDGGRELLNAPVLNYTDGNLDAVGEMLQHPTSAFGLGDGGAHAGQTCDASTTTFLLTHWARDRDHGRLTVEEAVHKMTQATATLYGLGDRGVLAPGFVGDANVIDYERLQLRRPELVRDLPGGASRLIQQADGYVTTIKGGVPTFVGGEDTGARPGALLRGAR